MSRVSKRLEAKRSDTLAMVNNAGKDLKAREASVIIGKSGNKVRKWKVGKGRALKIKAQSAGGRDKHYSSGSKLPSGFRSTSGLI